MPEKVYCGTQPELPGGYSRFGNLFECLRKGYGVCLYSGKLGKGVDRATTPRNKMWLYIFLFLHILCVILLAFIVYRLVRSGR